MRILNLIIVFTLSLWANTYDTFLLETQVSLLPKIALLEKNIAKNDRLPLVIVIAYDKEDEANAQKCLEILGKRYNSQIGKRPLLYSTIPFSKLPTLTNAHVIYALKGNLAQMKTVSMVAQSLNALSALYEVDRLTDDGILLSIIMERQPVILLNPQSLKESHFAFSETLYGITRLAR